LLIEAVVLKSLALPLLNIPVSERPANPLDMFASLILRRV